MRMSAGEISQSDKYFKVGVDGLTGDNEHQAHKKALRSADEVNELSQR
jgi:hypothetical protein